MRTSSKGFTLVELMIVVAIIGILAAIAIPNFVAMQLKSKRAELPSNVGAIKTAELSYDAAFDGFMTASVDPTTLPGRTPAPFDTTNGGFISLGWRPDGEVRGQYSTATSSGAGGPDFTVTAVCDVDGDSVLATYTASRDKNATLATSDVDHY